MQPPRFNIGVVSHGKPPPKKFENPLEPSPCDALWFPSVARDLTLRGCHTYRPPFRDPHIPDTEIWNAELDRYPIGPDTVLIGYSQGGNHQGHWMNDRPDVVVGGLVWLAFWCNPAGNHEGIPTGPPKPSLLARSITGLDVVNCPAEDTPQADVSLKMLRDVFGNDDRVRYHTVESYGHTDPATGKHVFPGLVSLVLTGEMPSQTYRE
jgi:hypothetical protein